MKTYCDLCKRPYAGTEVLLAGLMDLETTQEYHESTDEHRRNEKEAP